MDELTEMIEMIQTKKMPRIPIILMGRTFWEGYLAWVRRAMLEHDPPMINSEDLDTVTVVDSAAEAFRIIEQTEERPYFAG